MHNEQRSLIIERLNSANNIIEYFLWLNRSNSKKIVHIQGGLPEQRADGRPKRNWTESTLETALQRILKLSAFIDSFNFPQGSSVAIISNTRSEWSEIDYAILASAQCTVSIYPSLLPEDIAFILQDSQSRLVFAENQECLGKIRQAITANPQLQPLQIALIEDEGADGGTTTFKAIFQKHQPCSIDSVLKKVASVTRESTASLVYTSGTTGIPKGVIQSHGNHLSNVRQALESYVFGKSGTLFLYLPLAHSFARLVQHVGFLTESCIIFPAIINRTSSKIDLQALGDDIAESGANYFPSVPRLFEKIKSSIEERFKGGGLQATILKAAICSAVENYNNSQAGKASSILNRVLFRLTIPVRRKVREKIFGKNFSHAIIGGAKLNPDLNRFFDAIEIPLYEGYGLTETCVATNVNLPHRKKIGSVGPAFKDTEVAIAEDGEILFRGPSIAKGYLNNPAETAKAWDTEGWFHTGDIGHLDNEGFLFVTDRKKEIIVTAGGKNISPQKVEQLIKNSPLVSQVLVYGDSKPYCVALIWPLKSGRDDWKAVIEKHINEVNKQLASFEQVKKFSFLQNEPSIDNGMLTPTLKPKRKVIFEKFAGEILKLY